MIYIDSLLDDINDILRDLKVQKNIYDPDRKADPEKGKKTSLQVDEDGCLMYSIFQSDDDIVVAFKKYINTAKIKREDILRGDYAKRWNYIYNLQNNFHMNSKTMCELADILNIKLDLQFVKIEVPKIEEDE